MAAAGDDQGDVGAADGGERLDQDLDALLGVEPADIEDDRLVGAESETAAGGGAVDGGTGEPGELDAARGHAHRPATETAAAARAIAG